MSELSLTLLGHFQAHFGGNVLPRFRTSKVQALLIYLAVEPEAHGREHLMELFWPGMPERSARHNLRQVLYYLRGAIPAIGGRQEAVGTTVPLLLSNRQTIQLNPAAAVTADIYHFDSYIRSIQTHEHLNLLSCRRCRETLAASVALYQGDFLADVYLDDSSEFEDWAQVQREAYRRRVLDALETLTAMALRGEDYPLAHQLAERQLDIDNLRESSYRQLMQILALSGRREEAVAVYEGCRRLLAEELGMEPARRTTEIYDQVLAGDLSFGGPQPIGIRGYEIKEEIGAGAYGTIHRAIQPVIEREVAVKVIQRRYANNPEFIRRFEDEAQMIARLEHPHIVPLYDYWRNPEGAYLVMRYMKGGSLLSSLAHGPWDLLPSLRLIEQIASALGTAHQAGIVHRDIKPANILLDKAGNAFLSDFGIAKGLPRQRALTAPGAILGTPDYISPEQILNEEVGPGADQYSLGAVLFELLSGEKPFGDASVANLVYRHLNEPFPLLSESRPDLPVQIDDVLQKATSKRPAERYERIEAMAAALRETIVGPTAGGKANIAISGTRSGPRYNPYKGLQAFQESDAEDFFGRDDLIDRLIGRLAVEPEKGSAGAASRFLAVVGPSGSGKSSVVKAGLVPALRSGAIPGSEKWFIAEMVPGSHPLEELELALWPVAVDPPPSLVEPMQRDVRGLLRTLRRILPDEPGAQLLLIIDQFEELFTLVADEERRAFFLESLVVALTASRSPLRVVITLRADFYDRPLQLLILGQLLKQSTEIILPLTPEELAWAVREPARHVGVNLEPGLTETIVADVLAQPGALPLLQYALTELFERRQGNQITLASYLGIGGISGALSRRAEAIYSDMEPEARAVTRQLFLRLVRWREGDWATRQRILRAQLKTLSGEQAATVIDAFTNARLLTLDHDPLTRASTVEVAHEALLSEWERLRRWLIESRDDIRLQSQLAQAAVEWLGADREDSYLLRGARLAQFEAWSDAGSLLLTAEESAFLSASIAEQERQRATEEARRQSELATASQLAETESRRAQEQANAALQLQRRARVLAGSLGLALLLALTAILFGRRANINAGLAQSRELAAASLLSQDSDPELSLLLAAQALAVAQTSEAEQALHLALLASRVRGRLLAHETAIQRVAYSSDGGLIALAAHGEERATIWQAPTGQKLHEIPINSCCWGLFFDAEGRQLAAVEPGARFSLAIWDTATGAKIRSYPLPIQASSIGHYYVNPDWTQVAVYRLDRSLTVWDLEAGTQLFRLWGHSGFVEMEYSKDGRRLVSYDNPHGQVYVWDTATGERVSALATGAFINDHAVSPDGRQVALAVDADGAGWQIHIWDIDSDASVPSLKLSGHPDTIRLIDFSRDGQLLASASRDGTAKVWEVATGELLYDLAHGSSVRSLVFHPAGHRLLTSDVDGAARVWDITPQGATERLGFLANDGPVFDADLSPDGQLLLTGGPGHVWELATGRLVHDLRGHWDETHSVAFHPDGGQFATASIDGTAHVWTTESGEALFTLSGHGPSLMGHGIPGVLGVAYHPGGDRLATAGADGTARIWNSETGALLHILKGHTADLSTLAFSPDGAYLATGQASGEQFNVVTAPTTVHLWDVETGQSLFSFDSNHGGRLWGLTFAPDGRHLVTSGTDFVVRIWALNFDTGQSELKATLSNHTNSVFGLAFSPDGRFLATATPDEMRLWEIAPLLEGRADPIVTERLTLPGGPALAFTPDGKELVTGGRDGLVRVYLLDPDDLLALAQTRLTRWWTETECRLYLHKDSCPPAPAD